MLKRLPVMICLLLWVNSAWCQKEKYKAAREAGDEIFVITADGVKHTGSKIKLPNKYPPPFVKLDGEKYSVFKPAEILAYQDENNYVLAIPGSAGLAPRYAKGKINLYACMYSYFQNGHYELISRWVLEKTKGIYLNATFENLEKVFADNAEVMAKYNAYFPAVKDKTVYFSSNIRKEESVFRDRVSELVEMYNK